MFNWKKNGSYLLHSDQCLARRKRVGSGRPCDDNGSTTSGIARVHFR